VRGKADSHKTVARNVNVVKNYLVVLELRGLRVESSEHLSIPDGHLRGK
jgi:hypothetical protein